MEDSNSSSATSPGETAPPQSSKAPPMPVPCPRCAEIFNSRYLMKKHLVQCNAPDPRMKRMGSASTAKPVECVPCHKVFFTPEAFHAHEEKVHSPVMAFTCHICNAPFRSKYFLQTHMKVHEAADNGFQAHNQIIPQPFQVQTPHYVLPTASPYSVSQSTSNSAESSSSNNKYCHFCDKSFYSKVTYQQHMVTIHVGRRVCPECNGRFRSKYLFEKHKAKVHNKDGNTKQEPAARSKNVAGNPTQFGSDSSKDSLHSPTPQTNLMNVKVNVTDFHPNVPMQKTYSCAWCYTYFFDSEKTFEKHLKDYHGSSLKMYQEIQKSSGQ